MNRERALPDTIVQPDYGLPAIEAAGRAVEQSSQHEGKAPWQRGLLASLLGPDGGLEHAARSYQAFRREHAVDDAAAFRTWCASQDAIQAELFSAVHAADPDAADRLAEAMSTLPEVGSEFLGFRLIAELGRGAFGKVFLAEQGDLADRYVALKVASDILAESQTLAQLQHTNIVPIYSIHSAPPFQAVCMPYFGATTLADILHELAAGQTLPVSGKLLISTLNDRKASTRHAVDSALARSSHGGVAAERTFEPAEPLPATPQAKDAVLTLNMLEHFSYEEAVLWLAARLADGLAHAHERGILHRDLKPANILLTDEGQPMLLDFNLSADVKLSSSAAVASVGGTLPYMAPEHLQAFLGDSLPVDARSDLYSLGIILYELLTGKHPFPVRGSASREVIARMVEDRSQLPIDASRHNTSLSPAVASILERCLAPDPVRRYQSARELHEDLERQLQHLPLRHAPERSWRERAFKWVRRHPRLTSLTSAGTVAIVLIGLLASGFVVRGEIVARHEARSALDAFQGELRTAQFLLCARDPEREQLDEGVAACRRALDQYQVLDNPSWTELPAVRRLDEADGQRLRAEVAELLLLLAHGTARQARFTPEPQVRKNQVQLAMHWNSLVESRAGTDLLSSALWMQRADLAEVLGEKSLARDLREKARSEPPRSVRDLYLTAREYEEQGDYRKALPLLQEATHRDPRNFAAWFVQGLCHDALSQDADALACFSACVALRPDFHGSWHNRGLVFLKQQFYTRALADFGQAIALRPDLPDCYIDRALAEEGLGDFAAAVGDLTEALHRGTPRTRVYFMRAYARERAGDADGARRDTEEGLRLPPTDEKSWIARGLAKLAGDPRAALADFEAALELNPRSIDALQDKAHVLGECLHRNQDAIEVLDRAVALNPDFVPARAGRGILLARLRRRDAALADARESLLRDTRPPNLYQVAGIFALLSPQHPEERIQALQLLSTALRSGFGLDLVDQDDDLNPIRKDPEFGRVVAAARALHGSGVQSSP